MDSFEANSNWVQPPALLPSEFYFEEPSELLVSLTEYNPSTRDNEDLETLIPTPFSSPQNVSDVEPLFGHITQTSVQQEVGGSVFEPTGDKWTCGSLSGVSGNLCGQQQQLNLSLDGNHEISLMDDARKDPNTSQCIDQYRFQTDKERIKRELEAALGTSLALSEHHSHPETSFVSSKSDSPASPRSNSMGVVRESNRQKRTKNKRARAPARPWTEEEHQRFKASLELYGRNWEKCAKYIGTRRAQLVRSHAQKYLIKLWKLGKPLPKKVAESGKGYTLSGKPLLAESASARSYLTRITGPTVPVDQSD